MFKLAVIALLVGAAAAFGIAHGPVVTSVVSPAVSSQRAIIPHVPHYGHGAGVSARYFDRADYGVGYGAYGVGIGGIRAFGPRYYGGAIGNVYDGIDSLGLAYNNYDLGDGRLRYAYGPYGYGGFGHV